MSAAEWIAKRRELLAEFLKPYRGKRHDNAGLSILAMSDLPHALAALEAVLAIHRPLPATMKASARAGRQAAHVCTGCGTDAGKWEQWPCPTVRAIESALRGES